MNTRIPGILALAVALVLGVLPEAPAQSLAKWKFGIVQIKADTAFEKIGAEKGFYKEQGLDVEFFEMAGDAHLQKALIAGHVDEIETTPAGVIVATEKGANLRMVASFMPGLPHVLYVRKELNAIKDLVGKPIAISGLNALPHLAVVTVLQKYGIEASRVTWVQAGGDPDRMKAIFAGKVAATMSSNEFIPMLRQNPDVKVLFSFNKELPQWVRMTTNVTEKTVRERGDLLFKALVAHAKGIRYAAEHKDETVALMAKLTKRDPKDLDAVYDWFVKGKLINPNGTLPLDGIAWMQEVNIKIGRQDKRLPMSEIVVQDFQKKLVAQLGEHPW